MANKIQFTQDGYENIQKEFAELQKTKQPQAVDRLQKARSMGDISENSEYHAANEELIFIEGRIREIKELINKAEIIKSSSTDKVTVGTDVIVEKDGKEETFSIVGEFEANPLNKKLSATSPIGKSLIGKKVGNTVVVEVPAGKLKYKILKIKK